MEGVVRPLIVYLENPITINGFTIRHTVDGLKYLIDHYEQMLSKQVSEKVRSKEVADLMQIRVTEWRYHLTLYENQTNQL